MATLSTNEYLLRGSRARRIKAGIAADSGAIATTWMHTITGNIMPSPLDAFIPRIQDQELSIQNPWMAAMGASNRIVQLCTSLLHTASTASPPVSPKRTRSQAGIPQITHHLAYRQGEPTATYPVRHRTSVYIPTQENQSLPTSIYVPCKAQSVKG
ncbi:hypothetical protein CCMA1212_010526 [Trichoderma ghanense]|uniref:Uncharacterized protein n=1 Tax=Trichoderma ghanense TaxID=65468 RepID=A0ABY2GPJ2_9HYPO